jgi:hypothetical protein
LQTLQVEESETRSVLVPSDARWLGVWINPRSLGGRVALEALLRDSTGRYFSFAFGPDAGAELPAGWSFAVADLSRPLRASSPVQFAATPPQGPFELTALSIRFATRVSINSGSVLLDDLQASSNPSPPAGMSADRLLLNPPRTLRPFVNGTVVADFEDSSAWTPLQGLTTDTLPDDVRVAPSGAAGSALELSWRPGSFNAPTHGVQPSRHEPLPVLASDGFLTTSGLKGGDSLVAYISSSYVQLRIVGSFGLFPTLDDPREKPALVASGSALQARLNANPRGLLSYPTEVWLRPGPESQALAERAVAEGRLNARLVSHESIRAAQQKDPLVAAGWQGILFISFGAILALSAIGFLIYSYLTAQRRRLEFAVLRTLGFSRRQIALVVGFEQAFVIGLGMLAGTLLGMRLGSLMIGYMGVTETGSEVQPPMLLQVDWPTIAGAWLVLAAVFLGTITLVVLLYWRLALHRVLRMGEA